MDEETPTDKETNGAPRPEDRAAALAWSAPVTDEALAALAEKYRALRALRAPVEDASTQRPTEALRALARKFPGALRELDQLTDHELERRSAMVAEAQRGGPPDPLLTLLVGYHGLVRAMLCVRHLLRALPATASDAECNELLRARYPNGWGMPPLAWFRGEALAAARRPPGGRVNPYVFGALAHAAGRSPRDVEVALFPRAG